MFSNMGAIPFKSFGNNDSNVNVSNLASNMSMRPKLFNNGPRPWFCCSSGLEPSFISSVNASAGVKCSMFGMHCLMMDQHLGIAVGYVNNAMVSLGRGLVLL